MGRVLRDCKEVDCLPHRCSGGIPAPRRGANQRGHSLSQKRMAPLEPQEKDFDWQSQARMAFVPPEGDCLRAALPRLELLYDLPLLLSSAAALESERKCSVITCCRWHNIAASAAKPPRQTIASLYKSKVGGNCVRLPNRRQSDSEDRSKPSRLDTKLGRHFHSGGIKVVQNRGCQSNAFLLDGHTARFLSRERKWGVWSCRPQAAYPSAPCAESSAPLCGAQKKELSFRTALFKSLFLIR